MKNYKILSKPVKHDFLENIENDRTNYSINLDFFFENHQILFSNCDSHIKIAFLNDCGDIYGNEQVLPIIINSGFFNSILNSINDMANDIFEILNLMIKSSQYNRFMLLKNNLILFLILAIDSKNELYLQLSIDCITNILSQNYDTFENLLFVLLLIISTNIIDHILNNIKTNNTDIINSIITLMFNIFLILPQNQIDCDYNLYLFGDFVADLQNPVIFQKQKLINFIQQGFSFSNENIYYQTIFHLLPMTKHANDLHIICNMCKIISILTYTNDFVYNTLFNDFDLLSYINEWIKLQNPLINENLLGIIESLITKKEFTDTFSKDNLEKIGSMTLRIFDQFILLDDESAETESIKSLSHIIQCIKSIIPQFLINERRNFIIHRFLTSEYRLSHKYGYLIMIIASEIHDYKQIINENVLIKLFEFMDKGCGNFTQCSLTRFEMMLHKQQINNSKDLMNSFIELGGIDLIQTMLESANYIISSSSKNLMNHFFN